VFWHSSAHVLGESAEKHYGCHLCIGPPTDDGFFYEMAIDGRAVTNADYPALEKLSDGAIKEKQKFERIVVPKETLLKMFGVRWMMGPLCNAGSNINPSVQQIQEAHYREQDP
jgi:threonyl-tRNA synthetase